MKKSYVLGQYLNRIRKSLQNAGYRSNEIRNFLLQTLAVQRIEDITIAEPDLEEIFLHYYQEGGELA